MEQKKILWIVVAISVFALVIFGAALFLFAPSRSTGANLQQASAITPATSKVALDPAAQNRIDPDAWVQDPAKTPGLDAQPQTAGINLTIVNGDNAGANYGTLDVTGLTDPTKVVAVAPTDSSLPLTAIPGQAAPASETSSQKPEQTAMKETAQAPATQPKAPPASTVKQPTSAKPAPVPAPKKAVTEYWVQTGSFSSKGNAEKARENLKARYLSAEIFTKATVGGATTYRVRVGPYKSKTEAEYWLGTIKEIPEFSASYVSEVKTLK